MIANTNYRRGDDNHATKIKAADRAKLLTMEAYKLRRLAQIEQLIESLKTERERIKKSYSRKQLALDFGVHPQQIRRIVKSEMEAGK